MRWLPLLAVCACVGRPLDCVEYHASIAIDSIAALTGRIFDEQCRRFDGVVLDEQDADSWYLSPEHPDIEGHYLPDGRVVQIGPRQVGLLHELLHDVEWVDSGVRNENHDGWRERGWFSAAGRYQLRILHEDDDATR